MVKGTLLAESLRIGAVLEVDALTVSRIFRRDVAATVTNAQPGVWTLIEFEGPDEIADTNGLLRQYFPKGTDLSVHSAADLDWVAAELNDRPRKRLAFRKPIEEIKPLLLRRPLGSADPATGRPEPAVSGGRMLRWPLLLETTMITTLTEPIGAIR